MFIFNVFKHQSSLTTEWSSAAPITKQLQAKPETIRIGHFSICLQSKRIIQWSKHKKTRIKCNPRWLVWSRQVILQQVARPQIYAAASLGSFKSWYLARKTMCSSYTIQLFASWLNSRSTHAQKFEQPEWTNRSLSVRHKKLPVSGAEVQGSTPNGSDPERFMVI